MFAIQTAIKYTEKKIWRYLLLGVIGFTVIAAIFCINKAKANNITVVDTFELLCDINVSADNEIRVYKLTVTGYLKKGEVYAEKIPPVVFQSFDLITDGAIENIENIVLFAYINGDTEAVKYDFTYAVLEEIDIGKHDKGMKSIH